MAREPVWFAVRCLVEHEDGFFEERITLWWARSSDEAVAQAVEDSELYAGMADARHVGLVGVFCLPEDEPRHGSEVFSAQRHSDLAAEDYIRTFFRTGNELPDEVGAGDERFSG
jgi:hypothetical protein